MRINAFTGGNWYKGNTHAHTNVSDAAISPRELCDIYKSNGYSFLALTDHEIYTDTTEYDSDGFITLPGVELMLWHNSRQTAFTAHMVGIGIPEENKFAHMQTLEYNKSCSPSELAAFLHENGNYAIFAHPRWSSTRLEHFNQYSSGADALEIYNNTCEIACGNGLAESYFETALWGGRKIWAVASDDTHQHQKDYCGGFIMLKAPDLSRESIIKSIADGNFYSSTGAVIDDFYVEDGTAYVTCPGAEQICIYSDLYPGFAANDPSGKLTSASWKYVTTDGVCNFVRCKVVNKDGIAFSQPIWLNK